MNRSSNHVVGLYRQYIVLSFWIMTYLEICSSTMRLDDPFDEQTSDRKKNLCYDYIFSWHVKFVTFPSSPWLQTGLSANSVFVQVLPLALFEMEAFVLKILPSLLLIVLMTSSAATEKLSMDNQNGKNRICTM